MPTVARYITAKRD